MKVAVLLATYNGAPFLQEQLDSLLKQTYKDFNIYISYDGSIDKTKVTVNYSTPC